MVHYNCYNGTFYTGTPRVQVLLFLPCDFCLIETNLRNFLFYSFFSDFTYIPPPRPRPLSTLSSLHLCPDFETSPCLWLSCRGPSLHSPFDRYHVSHFHTLLPNQPFIPLNHRAAPTLHAVIRNMPAIHLFHPVVLFSHSGGSGSVVSFAFNSNSGGSISQSIAIRLGEADLYFIKAQTGVGGRGKRSITRRNRKGRKAVVCYQRQRAELCSLGT